LFVPDIFFDESRSFSAADCDDSLLEFDSCQQIALSPATSPRSLKDVDHADNDPMMLSVAYDSMTKLHSSTSYGDEFLLRHDCQHGSESCPVSLYADTPELMLET
jgi:hypothetical protein